jgi:hypothetical protein
MPNQLANTQADSIMVPIYLLTAAALCVYLERERTGAPISWAVHLPVILRSRCGFLMRPEGVVGWAALSLVLYWRSPRWLALPALLCLAIGLSWGLYKRQYTGEFSMTTNTVGDNAWISLWQAPSKFRWQTMDASYFEFERPPRRPAALQARLGSGAARGGALRPDLSRLRHARRAPQAGAVPRLQCLQRCR